MGVGRLSAEDARQFGREMESRRAEAEELRRALARQGYDTGELEALIRQMRALESARVYDDPEVLEVFPMAPTIRDSLELAASRPQTAYYSEVSGGIQRTYHPPSSVTPGQTGEQAAELISAVLAGEQLL